MLFRNIGQGNLSSGISAHFLVNSFVAYQADILISTYPGVLTQNEEEEKLNNQLFDLHNQSPTFTVGVKEGVSSGLRRPHRLNPLALNHPDRKINILYD